jgi:fluoroacetyl-CoA thioesterase
VEAECVSIQGPRITFRVSAHDGMDSIGEGTHQRFVVRWDRFQDRLADKARKISVSA